MAYRSRLSYPALSAILLSALFLAACQEAETVNTADQPRPVKAVRVSDFGELGSRWFAGRAKATQEVSLSFRVSGQLLSFPVVVGDEVKAGDLVAELDAAPYRAEVDRIDANVSRGEATLANAEQQFKRDETLFKQGHVSGARLDIRTAELKKARADLAAYRAQLGRAELDFDYTKLLAPFGGRVVATYVDNFEDVRAQQQILRVVDTSRIEMTIDIPENLISFTPYVEDIRVVFDAFPDLTIPAEIKEVGTEASETTRTFPVTLIMDQPESATILPGMAGRATGNAREALEAQGIATVEIPVSATFSAGGSDATAVWVIDEVSKLVSRRDVQTGQLTDHGIEVMDGLKAGEWIVVAGVNSIKEGQQVRILEQ